MGDVVGADLVLRNPDLSGVSTGIGVDTRSGSGDTGVRPMGGV